MSINKIFPVYQLNHEILSNSSGIMLINADKRPPHLGIYTRSKYYSVSVNDIQLGNSIEVMLQYIHRKRIPTIFIRLKNDLLENELESIFQSYGPLNGQATCIQPIKEVFYNKIADINRVSFVFELIPILKKNGWVKSYHHLYSSHLLEEKAFTLRTYSMQDVMDRINKLVNDKG